MTEDIAKIIGDPRVVEEEIADFQASARVLSSSGVQRTLS